MIIRVLGIIVGILALLTAPLLAHDAVSIWGVLNVINAIVIGILFTIYGFTGKKYLSKIIPSMLGKKP